MFCKLAPIVAFMLIGGVVADRFPRALLVGVGDVVLSGFVVLNGIMFITGTATVVSISVIAFIGGTLTALWWPAMSGLMPDLVEPQDLQQANSIIGIAANSANLAGTVIGGALVATVGAGPAIVIDGLTFLTAGLLVLTLRGSGRRRETGDLSPTVVEDLRHGWREFLRLKWVVAVVAGYSVLQMLFESLVAVLGPVRAKEALGGPRPWSYVLAAWSVGMMTGVVAMLRVHLRRPLVTALTWQIGSVMWFIALGSTTHLPLIMLAAFFCGVGTDVLMITWQTALQQHVPSESLSRVNSYDAFGSLLFTPLGLLIAGPVAERFGSAHALLVFGAGFALVLAAVIAVPAVRSLPPLRSTLSS
jgi:MFS family permease